MAGGESPAPLGAAAAGSPATKAHQAAVLVFIAFLNALCFPLITVGLPFAPHLSFAFLRALVAGSALALTAALLRRPMPRGLAAWSCLAGVGLGTTSLGFIGMFHASEFVSPGLATVIANSQPLIAALLARVALGEQLRPLQRAGLLLGFVGILVISLPRLGSGLHPGFGPGFAYLILAAAGVAGGNVTMKALGGRIDPLVAMAAQLLIGAVPLALGAALSDQPWAIDWTPSFIASLLGLSLPGTALVYWLWFSALAQVSLSRANSYTFLAPFIGFGIAVAFFGEPLSLSAIMGLSVSAAGIVMIEWPRAPAVAKSRS